MAYLANSDRNSLRIKAQGLINESWNIANGGSASLMITQRAYYIGVGLKQGDVIANVLVLVTTGGTTTTNLFVGLYDSAGTRLAVSNDLTTALDGGSAGYRALALSSSYTVTQDGGYYVAILVVNAVTCPTLQRNQSGAAAAVAPVTNMLGTTYTQSSITTLPTPTATFASTAPLTFWVGLT